jgi:hypothetical protein
MSNLQQTSLSQLPSDVWALMIAPVSKNTVSTMPIDDAKQFIIESYLIYRKRAAELAEKDYKEALNNWKECKKILMAHTKKMMREGWPSCVVSTALSLQYDILQQRKFKLNQIKLDCYKTYREAHKNADSFANIKLLAAAYGREHKIKKPFEIAAWQRVWQAEGTIRNLEWSLYLREQELNESMIYLQENIKQLEFQNECLANAAITITQLQAKNEQLKKQIAENNKYCGTSKKLVLLTAKPNSEKPINKMLC